MLPQITQEFLNEIYNKKIKHKFYDETVKHAEEMSVHVDGVKPERLLNIQRPNETPEVKKYRLDIWQPITKSSSEKVINTLNKVFNPRLHKISFQDTGEDSLAEYLTKEYPGYRSIMNFIRETYTPKDMSDPNAVMVIIPQNFDIPQTERFEPVPIIYESFTVVDFELDEYYIIVLDNEIQIYTTKNIEYWELRKTNSDTRWQRTFDFTYEEPIPAPPVFRLGGVNKGRKSPYFFESFMAGVLPHWNQVIGLSSDLAAQYTLHMFLEKWQYETDCDAPGCQSGQVQKSIYPNGAGTKAEVEWFTCQSCNGTGKKTLTPYGVHTINREALNPDEAPPTPPFGYPGKPIDIVDKVEDRISKEIQNGFSSINMEILNKVGENQSGVAKTIDRQDLDSFLLRYAAHVFEYVLPNMIFYTILWRYPDKSLESVMPLIEPPTDLNILTLDKLTSEYSEASAANVSANYLNKLEEDMIKSKFINDEEEMQRQLVIVRLNPYPGKTIDDLLTLQNLGEPDWKIYKFNNLIEIITRAIEENPNFLELPLKEQRRITDEIAKEDVAMINDIDVLPVEP